MFPTAIPSFIRRMKQSSTLTINQLAAEMEGRGQKVFRLGFGQSPFPIPNMLVDAVKKEAHRGEYTNVNGIPPLREAIAKFYSKRDGRNISSEDVIIAPGSKELLYLTQLACQKASIYIPSPTWVSYPAQVEMQNKDIHYLLTSFEDKWKLTPSSLDTVKLGNNPNKLMILTYPNNPTGLTYSKEELDDLIPVLEETKTVVVCDEIYHDVHFKKTSNSLAQILPEQSIISSGLSKNCGAGGWRLGYMVFPPSLAHIRKAMASLASETYSCAPTPMQYAALEAFSETDELDSYRDNSCKIMHALGVYCSKLLNNANIRCHDPEGGFYIFPDFSHHIEAMKAHGINNSAEMCEDILAEKAVTLLPGSDFRAAPHGYQARLCFVAFDGKAALENCPEGEIDEKWLRQYCENVVVGVERICDWALSLHTRPVLGLK